jgi:hypothetical protein
MEIPYKSAQIGLNNPELRTSKEGCSRQEVQMNVFGVAVLVGLVPVMLIVGALFLTPLLSYYAG